MDVHDLHKHAIEFLEESKGYPVLADPAAGFAKLLELFAAAESKAMYAGDLKAAASILSKAATDGKLPVNLAGTAKRLASEATKLASEVETRRIFFLFGEDSLVLLPLGVPDSALLVMVLH